MTNLFIYLLAVGIVASAPSTGIDDAMKELLRRMIQLEARYSELRRENAELRSVVTSQQTIDGEYTNDGSNIKRNLRNEEASEDDTVPLQRKLNIQERKIQQLTEKQEKLEERLRDLEKESPVNTKSANQVQNMILGDKTFVKELSSTLSNISKKCAFSGVRTRLMLGDSSQAQIVTYDEQNANKGKDFDIDTGIFTCEVPGIYYFSFTMRSYHSHSIGITLVKNGELAVSMLTDGDPDTRDIMQSQSVMLDLVAEDEVWLQLGPHDDYAVFSSGSKYITFNGFILYPNLV
ncbi:complement C1q tumor necrosis factor-related protein 6-like [Ptychodera flava]|uniref:complement C1q tumor necrosis factor-related protein 6-like n=1 Tax=Ptychodera flava TaxID=63121 RepID=UPI00396A403A